MEGSVDSDLPVSSRQDVCISMESNIFNLPWEILQEIFCHLDGKSLLMCKRVCKSWRDNVHHLEQKTNFWYDNCQKDIPSWAQLDLLDNMFPCHWKDQSQVDWEEIYKCWFVWNSLFQAPVTIDQRFSGLNEISSVKVSGEWLFVSTCKGRGKLCTQKLTASSNLIDLYMGGGAILNFELVVSDRNPYSNIRPVTTLEELFDSLGHNEIWLELKDCYVQLGKTYRHKLDKIQQKVRHSYGYEMRLVTDHNRSSIVLKKICSKVPGPELMELELSNCYSKIEDFWLNTISLSSLNFDKQLVVDAFSLNRRTQEATLTSSLGYNLEYEVCETYSWHGSLMVLYTSRRKIVIHQGGNETIQVTPIKKGRVTSVLFYVNHLFLGTDRGKLLVYKVRGPEDCLEISVFTTPSWDIDVCDGTIGYIAIAEPIHHKSKGPVIICATSEDIYFVSISV